MTEAEYRAKYIEPTRVPGPEGLYAADPWKHRHTRMRCGTCMWWVEKELEEEAIQRVNPLGRCRRHAPAMGGFPATFAADYCGDHKLDENKLESFYE